MVVVVVVVVGVELYHSWSGQCWRGGSGGMSTGELVLLLAGCNRQERWPQCRRYRIAGFDPSGCNRQEDGPAPWPGKAGDLGLVVQVQESWQGHQLPPRARSRALSCPIRY